MHLDRVKLSWLWTKALMHVTWLQPACCTIQETCGNPFKLFETPECAPIFLSTILGPMVTWGAPWSCEIESALSPLWTMHSGRGRRGSTCICFQFGLCTQEVGGEVARVFASALDCALKRKMSRAVTCIWVRFGLCTQAGRRSLAAWGEARLLEWINRKSF